MHLNCLMQNKLAWHNRCLQQKYDQMLRDVTCTMQRQQEKFYQSFECRHNALKQQIQVLCNKLHNYNPNFNFEEYYKNPEDYIGHSVDSDQPSMAKSAESASLNIAKAEQSVAVLEKRLERLREENADLEVQIAHIREEQRSLLTDALRSEANAQQRNIQLRDRQFQLANK